MSSPTTHVIFDCAGTLVDFFGPIITLGQQFGQEHGKEVKPEHFGLVAEHYSFSEGIKHFINNLYENNPNQVMENVHEFNTTNFKKLVDMGFKMIGGVDRLVRHLYEHNIPMAIASNMKTTEFNEIIEKTVGFEAKYFSHYVCGADDPQVKSNKPAPDVYLVCAQRFSPPPKSQDSCVIFEDSKLGITGALASGMKTVLLKNQYSDNCEELHNKITAVVDSFESFRPESVGLPPFKQFESME